MAKALGAGARYFLIVFVIGYLLGIVRTLVLLPRLGAPAAVALELPLILAASWWVSGKLVQRLPPGLESRAVVGGSAFALLIVAEFAMSVGVFGQTPAVFIAGWQAPAGLLGLLGQIAFGLMPLIPRR
jgi:hypothetical protein